MICPVDSDYVIRLHQQMPSINVRKSGKQACLDAGVIPLKPGQHFFYLHPFLVLITACGARTAGNRKTLIRCVANDNILRHINQGTDHHIPSIISMQEGGHCLDSAVIELVEQQCLDEIISVVSEGHLRASKFPRLRIQHASLDPGTEGAWRIVSRKFFEHKLMNRRGNNMMFKVMSAKILFHQPGLESGKARMHSDCNEREGDRCSKPQAVQYMKQGPTVLAARERDEDAIVIIYKAEIADCLACKPANVLFLAFYSAHTKNANA